ncbi:asparaginase [Billgrantia endophytica]|uniref:Asparaginase n=1 Tax=Billgrantia endophytica TaxID=2033802 RepID=A0A2N7UEC4_9GAMM|nr:asparaginase [Halomonas endophytica]PMR78783.1 asparaginase [Halomonas endophytica]
MKKVVIISTGGTIASRFKPETREVSVGNSSEPFQELAALRLPSIPVETFEFSSIGSYMMSLERAFELIRMIGDLLKRKDIMGVVVTHGTDTLEETAYMADLLLDASKPVVFTGAQKAADDFEPDGPRNVLDAIRVAADGSSQGKGVLVVFDHEIHAARDVTKTHTSQLNTFQSAEHGKLGEIDQDAVLFHRAPLIRATFPNGAIEPRVDIVKLAMGSDRRFIDCAIESGARGIVIEAFGRGNVTPDVLNGIEQAIAASVSVVIASRCPRGRVAPVYGISGGVALSRAGAVFAGDLGGIKARILLAILLGAGMSGDALKHAIEMASA